jgi:hypothetical protein
MEQDLRGAKRVYERLTVDKEAFQARLRQALAQNPPAPAHRLPGKKKFAAIAIPLAMVPILAFGYTHYFVWGGGLFLRSSSPEGPTSVAASPYFVRKVLTQPHTEIYTLSQSMPKAQFPIREPGRIPGWTKILSEGVQLPLYNERETANGHLKLVRITKLPLQYIDIYKNARGQRIAVTQKYSAGMSWAYKKYYGTTHWSSSEGFAFGSNYQRLSGFPGDMAWLESGTWRQVRLNVPGSFENVVVLHPEADRTVTTIVVDAYGRVSPSILESFAHAYLRAPVK